MIKTVLINYVLYVALRSACSSKGRSLANTQPVKRLSNVQQS